MHPNPIYRPDDQARNLALARERAFGTLAVSADGPPLLSHVPFLLSDDGTTAELHLVRSNPIARALSEPRPARLAVTGPDGYISPDWYGMDHQVPTWNYVAVHLAGRLERLPQDQMRDMLDRQSDAYETRLLPKPVWRVDKMPADALDKLLRMILPFRLHIEDVQGTWKFSQNKPEAARTGAADLLERSEFGAGTAALAALMRDWQG